MEAASRLGWGTGALELGFSWSPSTPVVLDAWGPADEGGRDAGRDAVPGTRPWGTSQPLVEALVEGMGRSWNNTRLSHTALGARLRHVSHGMADEGGTRVLTLVQESQSPHMRVTTVLRSAEGGSAVQAVTSLENLSGEAVRLNALSSLALGCLVAPGSGEEDLELVRGRSAQLAENRWWGSLLSGPGGLADVHTHLHRNQSARGSVEATGTSTWTTAADLPAGVLHDTRSGRALCWQVEHDGGWHWEVDAIREGGDALALVLGGPDDLHHSAVRVLAPGEVFDSVPVSVSFSALGVEGAVAAMTHHRRWLRSRHVHAGIPVVYNDYMNTLDGDPSEEVDLSLARAAAEVGAEVFCVDAGWYADSGVDWWASVGDWELSRQRFPSGLSALVGQVRDLGMRPGIWMEPEVVGVSSVAAGRLPDSAFLSRGGVRVREQDRYFLDLRDPAAREHLDRAVDALVDAGVEYFKFDYNVTPGAGSDAGGTSPGAGLLDHGRAHLDWYDALRRRHPRVVLESCSSGAMRSDFACLARSDLQSTSDQQDPLLYPPIAALSPMLMPPEVAGNWAYPQPDMSLEGIAFTMVTGLAGTPYLSGFLDRMTQAQLDLVREAVGLHLGIRSEVAGSVPAWPLGFPRWEDPVVVLALRCPDRELLLVWERGGVDHVDVPVGVPAGEVETLYPRSLPAWGLRDVEDRPGTVRMTPPAQGLDRSGSARVFSVPRRS